MIQPLDHYIAAEEPDWDNCSRCGRRCSVRWARIHIAMWNAGARLDPWLCAACLREWEAEVHRRRYREFLLLWLGARCRGMFCGPVWRMVKRRHHGLP